MACRHDDIENYEKDLETLNSILEKVKAMDACDEDVTTSLKSMGDVINDTLLAPGNVNVCLWLLNRKTSAAIKAMTFDVNSKIIEVEEQLKDAKWEDFWWHVLHPFG